MCVCEKWGVETHVWDMRVICVQHEPEKLNVTETNGMQKYMCDMIHLYARRYIRM